MGASPGCALLACRGLGTLTQVIRGRWFVLAVGIVVMIVSAGAYSFGFYSQKLKTALEINQETLNVIANFKDLGVNLGIHAGLLIDFWSPGGVLLVGAVETVVGYLLAWLSVTRRIPPSVWQMCLFLFLGANSQSMLNTAVMVQAVKLFPANKGIIISLMKGYIGVSGAILIQIYLAIQGSADPTSFLLLLVWLPSTVAVVSILVIRPVTPFRGLPDVKYFYWFLALGFALAFYMMGVTVLQTTTTMSITGERVIGGVLLIVLVVPLFAIAYRSEVHGKKSVEEVAEMDTGARAAADIEIGEEKKPREEGFAAQETAPAVPKSLKSCDKEELDQICAQTQITQEKDDSTYEGHSPAADAPTIGEERQPGDPLPLTAPEATEKAAVKKAWPRRGQDHSIWQTYRSLDFWLLFVATIFGVGSGLTVTDNMGQLGLSLGYAPANVRTFVSLLSIWNSIGRWVGGFLSEMLLQRYGTPRPKFHTITLGVMALGYLLIAVNVPGCLYFGSILLGLSFGAQYPVYTTIIAENFGLKYFGTLYNSMGIASPVGMYILSVPVTGRFYDAEARRQAGRANLGSKNLLCHGPSCFRRALFTLMGVTIGAAGFAGLLWYRTRHFYKEVHEDYQRTKREGAKASQAAEV